MPQLGAMVLLNTSTSRRESTTGMGPSSAGSTKGTPRRVSSATRPGSTPTTGIWMVIPAGQAASRPRGASGAATGTSRFCRGQAARTPGSAARRARATSSSRPPPSSPPSETCAGTTSTSRASAGNTRRAASPTPSPSATKTTSAAAPTAAAAASTSVAPGSDRRLAHATASSPRQLTTAVLPSG